MVFLAKQSDESRSSESVESLSSSTEERQSKPIGKPHATKRQTGHVTRVYEKELKMI